MGTDVPTPSDGSALDRPPSAADAGTVAARSAVSADADADKRRRMFAHEVRGPLTVVLSLVDLASEQPSEELRSLAVRARRQVEHLMDLIQDLAGARAGADAMERLPTVATSVESLLADVVEAATADVAGRDLRVVVSPPGLEVFGVASRLRQVLLNLVSNAGRHTPAGTPIELGAAAVGPDVLFTVADRGPGAGASAELLASGGGEGLGLQIASELVDRMDGTLALRPRLGGGLRAEVRIPQRRHADRRAADPR